MTESAARNRFKWAVFLIVLALLLALLAWRNLPSTLTGLAERTNGEVPAIAEQTGGDVSADSNNEAADEGAELGETEEAPAEVAATNPALSRPTIDTARYDSVGDQQILTLGGSADDQCTMLVSLDGVDVGDVALGVDGRWTVELPSPQVGTYEIKADCFVDGELVLFALRDLEVQAADAGSGEVAEDSTEDLAEADPAEEATESSTAVEEAAPEGEAASEEQNAETPAAEGEGEPAPAADEPADTDDSVITGELSEVTLANDEEWVAGYLLAVGKGTPGASVAVIFANGEGTVEGSTVVNEAGNWAVRAFLDTPGEYVVTARSGSNSAEAGTVSIDPNIVFGSKGLCGGGRVAPFGTLEGNQYLVADCEFFGLIARRLGISVAEFRAVNPQIFNLNLIQAGDTLNVPPLP